ncbi:portal protein lambda [Chthoniobacter flavus Ellin428]|uniref:Portal protein lambda n=1 Tax=Chthoniobacter flavus Ellin428 TaxID=497964 RepID=B4CXQ8_9BACT|nr:phage portal protein [Chthoniobacter flavus]EDY21056.1 portal protein lambda [Chthoniobacter flavus Ellin428]TCO88778.1 capsid protein [Chthoniobacter flavus]
MNPLLKLARAILPRAWFSPYEGANYSPRRARVPGFFPRDAKLDLSSGPRRELVRRSRYLHKNSGFVRELVGSMAIYATGDGIKPQALSADANWNKAAHEYFARWAARCEITQRFSFAECQSLVCRGMDVDGEYFLLKTRDALGAAKLQLIESHRIGDAEQGNTEDGIEFDAYGAPAFYRILLDGGGFKDIPAPLMLHVFEPENVTGVRNAPTLQHSVNHLLDEMELIALEKHAVKDNADVARVLKTERGDLDEDGDFTIRQPGNVDPAATEPSALQRIVGGKLVALKPGESLDSFQSNRPSPTFTGFLEYLRRDSALGHIPYEFAADSSKVGGAGVRLVVAKADRRFSYRQLILIERFLKPVWLFVIGDAIATKRLPEVVNWTKVAFTTPRRITVDAGREAQQNRADVETGLKTIEEHFAEQGMDFAEEMEIRAQNARALLDLAKKYDIPLEMLWNPDGGTAATPAVGESDDPPPSGVAR